MGLFDFLKSGKTPPPKADELHLTSTAQPGGAPPLPGSAKPAAGGGKVAAAGVKAPPEPTVDELAKTMCERKAVHWAAESAKLGGGPMSPADHDAMAATQAWLKTPTAEAQKAAADAAMKAGHGGPAAWAAQAAAWAKPAAGGAAGPKPIPLTLPGGAAAGGLPGAPGGSSLAGLAVSGAVALAAAVKGGVKLPAAGGGAPLALPIKPPAPPTAEEMAKTAELHKPFVDLGKKIAADPSVHC